MIVEKELAMHDFKIENKSSDTQYFKNQVEIDRGRERKQTQRQKDIFAK